jgi:hypothetical protein
MYPVGRSYAGQVARPLNGLTGHLRAASYVPGDALKDRALQIRLRAALR